MAPWKELPYEMEDCNVEEEKLIKKCMIGFTRPFVKCGKKKYIMPGAFKQHAEAIYNMEVRPDDVWVITYPRSGTTWTQEMVWLLENDLDYETSKEVPLYDRFPMLEITSMIPDIGFELIKMNFLNLGSFQGLGRAAREPSWKTIDLAPSPRFIKTHLPLSMLPPDLVKTARVVYVARDPRDAAVSFYYLQKMVSKTLLRANVSNFWEAFRNDLLPFTPIVEHAYEAWQMRHHQNMHFIFYEDMLKDLPAEIHRMCKFLNRSFPEDKLAELAKYLSFDNLKKNRSVNNTPTDGTKESEGVQFLRKGEAGGWKTHFDEKMELQAEEFLTERLRGKDLNYPTFEMYETTHL